jgi:hypothetical protein
MTTLVLTHINQAVPSPLTITQRTLRDGMHHFNVDPRLPIISRTEPTELREHAGGPRRPPLQRVSTRAGAGKRGMRGARPEKPPWV